MAGCKTSSTPLILPQFGYNIVFNQLYCKCVGSYTRGFQHMQSDQLAAHGMHANHYRLWRPIVAHHSITTITLLPYTLRKVIENLLSASATLSALEYINYDVKYRHESIFSKLYNKHSNLLLYAERVTGGGPHILVEPANRWHGCSERIYTCSQNTQIEPDWLHTYINSWAHFKGV